ncbi:MAG TPA: ABC transporter substrate-binding protein [Albitalea sp.]|nr:ABC transporter substrate-binding protein [Albitalea sp.]
MTSIRTLVVLMLWALVSRAAVASDVEVLHWWTSGGEAQSLAELKTRLQAGGFAWRDAAIEGGGGDAAMATLQQRVKNGNPPAAALMNSAAIQAWGRQHALANLDAVALDQKWDIQIPRVVAAGLKVDGHFVAAPFNIHRLNWLWINRDVYRRFGGRMPETWEQFFALAERMKRGGVLPIAHGGQPWQNFALFETVLLGVGGADFYRSALVNLDPQALSSAKMDEALSTLRRVKSYTDGVAANGRDWNAATAMVISGRAGMQFMGDWAKGEFFAAHKLPDRDFICTSTPGTERAFIFIVDSFAVFKQKSDDATAGQRELARLIMSGNFQQAFNLKKGSIPLATDVQMAQFDRCAQESSAYFVATSMLNTLVPSVAIHMSQPLEMETKLKTIVSDFWSDDSMSNAEAIRRLLQLRATTAALR